MLTALLDQPLFLPAMALAIAFGALAMLLMLIALDAIEARVIAKAHSQAGSHTPPLRMPTNSAGPCGPSAAARADLAGWQGGMR